MNTSRRQFLQTSLAATATGFLTQEAASAAQVDGAGNIPIVDTHQHLWDLDRLQLPWLKENAALSRSFTQRDYLDATAGLNVVKAVYMEVDVEARQQVEEAEGILALCGQGKSPTVAAVISGRPSSDNFREYLGRFKGNRYLKGVRQVLHTPATPAGYCLQPAFIRGLRVLEEQGLSYDLCMRPADLGDALKLVQSLPNLRFILDHCGNGDVRAKDLSSWRRDMERLAGCKNLVCKISGIVARARPGHWTPDDLAPVVNHSLEVFGPDRVMFGGDWPVCNLAASFRQWVQALQSLVRNRPADHQRKLFHDNAVRFYGLA